MSSATSSRAATSFSRPTPLRRSAPPGSWLPEPAPGSPISCSANLSVRRMRCRSREPITSATSRPRYVDDNYKITPKLSIQLGLRYELTPPWYDTLGNEFMVDLHTNNSPIRPYHCWAGASEHCSLSLCARATATTRIRGSTSAGCWARPISPTQSQFPRSAGAAVRQRRLPQFAGVQPTTSTLRLASAFPTRPHSTHRHPIGLRRVLRP